MALFANRQEAAKELAGHLDYLRHESPIVLGLADGGVPIAQVIAEALEAPLDVLLLERLRAPSNPDHVVGAVDEHGRISMIQTTARWHHLTNQQMVEPARVAFGLLQRRRGELRAILPELDVRDRTVIIVSQGVATGAKMLGAIASVRDRGARRVVAAAPAGDSRSTWRLHEQADVVVIPHQPSAFRGVESFYREPATASPEMTRLIVRRWVDARPQPGAGVRTFVMKVAGGNGRLLCCEIDLPPGTERGGPPLPAVVFAHGFESDGNSPRNVTISRRLAKRGVIGVRLDFTGHGRSEGRPEDATDERLLDDLRVVLQAVAQLDEVDVDRLGLCGSGTGGMVALRMAAIEPMVRAMVIRGPVCGKERQAARLVQAATLLIHAERDTALVDAVEAIDQAMAANHQLLRIPDSSRLFADPISFELMVGATVDWLVDHLAVPAGVRHREPPMVTTSRPADHASRS